MKNALNFKLIFLVSLFLSWEGYSQEKRSVFIDSTDNAFDLSTYLYDLNGFLPIAAPITEPAVGYGASLVAAFFIPKEKKEGENKFLMPDIVAGAGGYTENQTWFAGAGYMGFWNEDRVRYRGVMGYVNANLHYYGDNSDYLQGNPLKFKLKGLFLLQQAIFRLGDSNFMLGGNYQFFASETIFNRKSDFLPIDNPSKKIKTSGVGLIVEYEDLNNILSPTSGLRSNITYKQNLKLIGSDFDGGLLSMFTHYYLLVYEDKWISAFRLESQFAVGDNPFFALPFLYLRGVPAMRYQGDLIALAETEQQYVFARRWTAVGFAEIGTTFNYDEEQLKQSATAWNAGVGFRYLIARALGLKMGLDVAKGPEQWGVYVVFGTSWLK